MQREQKAGLLTAEDIAAMLKVKVQTVYLIARHGELEKVKLSRKCLRFRADDVETRSTAPAILIGCVSE